LVDAREHDVDVVDIANPLLKARSRAGQGLAELGGENVGERLRRVAQTLVRDAERVKRSIAISLARAASAPAALDFALRALDGPAGELDQPPVARGFDSE
jgi:hypothetical protein